MFRTGSYQSAIYLSVYGNGTAPDAYAEPSRYSQREIGCLGIWGSEDLEITTRGSKPLGEGAWG
jgi:hypothetical protein